MKDTQVTNQCHRMINNCLVLISDIDQQLTLVFRLDIVIVIFQGLLKPYVNLEYNDSILGFFI